ncbi:MAG: hypothetical protein HQK96_01500 [Nitrospirae bacterium]|nr:hypothetical protein [Nitrospirota bacterium]
MSIDRCFVSRLIESGDIRLFVEARSLIKVVMVKEPERSVYKFVAEYFEKYKAIPSFSLVEENFKEDFKTTCEADLKYYIDEITNREAYNRVSLMLNDIYPIMDRGRGLDALEKLDLKIKDIYKGLSSPDDIKSLFSYGDEVLEMYEKAKLGLVGISTPWETMNSITLGWQPEDLAMFIARPGVGKTWVLVLLAMHAWSVAKKKVLFVSPEIANARVLFRFLSAQIRADYEIMRKGKLGDMMEKKLREKIGSLMAEDDGNFKIIGRDFGSDLRAVEKGVILTEPDIVFVDGAYLINRKSKTVDKHERISEVIDELKGMGKKYSVPFVASSQLNRKASGKRDIKDDMISFTDAVFMDADYVFAMIQDMDMRADKIMNIQPIKIREGDLTRKIVLRWDFSSSDFSELATSIDGLGEIPF